MNEKLVPVNRKFLIFIRAVLKIKQFLSKKLKTGPKYRKISLINIFFEDLERYIIFISNINLISLLKIWHLIWESLNFHFDSCSKIFTSKDYSNVIIIHILNLSNLIWSIFWFKDKQNFMIKVSRKGFFDLILFVKITKNLFIINVKITSQ